MKKITLLLLILLGVNTFAQDVAPTFSWTNSATYKKGAETNVTFTPGQTYAINQTYSLGATAGVANTRWFVLMVLQSATGVVTDPLSTAVTWSDVTKDDGSGQLYPVAGTLNNGVYTATFNYKIPSTVALSSTATNTSYRMLFYLAYYKGGNTSMSVFGGAGASDLQLVKIRSAAEIASLSSASFNAEKLTSFYPNPAKDQVNFGSDVVTKTYKVINMTGSVVKDVVATGTLDVSDLPKGTYIIATDTGSGKLIKE